ncbi:hypothetical protein [Nocardia sp. NRRL WC-3656]|uniref:hypothetical protein n=1 Tax=Nocardia sp. NRRL WC-3656 TaxID=1463824 RepID=UPI001E5BF77D|nr:hypothetical protein [Nocardia sp. NRRL WC-3656]
MFVGTGGRRGRAEGGVGVGLPVRLHRRRPRGEDRVDDRRAHPAELEAVFTARGGPPKVLRMDNGPEMFPMRCNSFALIVWG